ncbi:NPCBM/NEW2 domain-containing protein [Haloferula sp. BvORR071]|uniref:NPCBM/NEW2 domain-containing protein n=1 Tax=Haloferula sp. BvORR071 TaxID=1396141 RepID=UPI000698DEEE|nr:NPCBM/NEW2 domain-containing protein [Haloferula sp. BvORR071]
MSPTKSFLCFAFLASPGFALDLPLAAQAYGELRENLAVEGGPLTIGGKVYPQGLGSHAVSEIPIDVPDGATRFTGAAGVDDAQGPGKGSVKFRILSGNAVLWESAELKSGDPAAAFDLPVSSILYRKLYLQADDLGENSYDHADWVDLQWKKEGGTAATGQARTFAGADFGIRPEVEEDQSSAFRKAIQALREAPGSTLKLAKGTYHFRREGALKHHFHVSNHDQPKWHPVSIPLVDLRGVTIDGQGSLFLFHGEVQPVLVMDSEKVTLQGIGIDYAIPHHSQGTLTKVEQDAYEVEVDPVRYPHEVRNGWPAFKGDGWETGGGKGGIVFDGKTREIVAGTSDYNFGGRLTELTPGHYRVEKNLAKSGIKTGDILTFRQGGRPHPAITLYRAKDTALVDCPIHSSHGMGLLAQRSENIRLSGGGVYPRKETGRYFSTVADATHFSNCKGLILSENGLYEGMMDDAINVHATCLRIEDKPDSRTLRCSYIHEQSIGFETFLPGETLRFIEAKHLTPRDPRKVVAVRRLSDTELIITLDSDTPADLGKGDAVENADLFPQVTFRGNTVRHNRARGSLFTTPEKVIVEGNTFESIAGSAILLAGDANGWYESGGCHDVLIRNNTFRDNLTSRFQFTEALISIYPEVPDLEGQKEFYHRNVRIEGNRFETFDVPLLFAMSTSGLSFTGNEVTYNDHYPAWNKPPFILRHCKNFVQKDNRVTRDGKPVEWTEKDIKSDP